jgi:acetyl-CoA synthetase
MPIKNIQSFEEYQEQYAESVNNPEKFWATIAESFTWQKKWDSVLNWNFEQPSVKWFDGAQLNITENCLDRHLATQPNKTAIIWEPNHPTEKVRKLTYAELHAEVCKAANMLKNLGIQKGDRVCIYMPMVVELSVAVLACARIGAIHSVVFAGFSAKALAERINDSDCKIVLTADYGLRGDKQIALKEIVDEALLNCTTVNNVVIYKRTDSPISFIEGRDRWWHEEMAEQSTNCPATYVNAEDELFILYTSGSTGKPKGVVHTTAGYMVFAEYSFRNVFQYQNSDIYWCTADIGWITGHSYIVYGPLLSGATVVLFEGVPTYPDAGRFWEVIAKHKVTIFYTAPTAIRALQAFPLELVTKHDLSSLRVLGSVGEPINDEAWEWYHKHIGKGNCPLVDTWWQTETGGMMIAPLAGVTPLKPTFATLPLPGIQPCLVDTEGNEIEGNGVEGNLCIKFPWPSMLRTTWGDHERCRTTYFSTYKNNYFTGDGCKRDENGYYRITGRVDDVINVSGHRIGTAEVEDAINTHPHVIESAVVGYPHDIKGQGIYAYLICDSSVDVVNLKKEVLAQVTLEIGAIAKPDKIQVVEGLPKTRSGKIMRRILRKIAEGDFSNFGDTSTLLDPSIVDKIKDGAQK